VKSVGVNLGSVKIVEELIPWSCLENGSEYLNLFKRVEEKSCSCEESGGVNIGPVKRFQELILVL
jgi:hypothetical protein